MIQLIRILATLIILPIVGTLGFIFIENLSPLDAAYMAFITLSTIGYEVVKPLSPAGKVFVIIYIMLGFSLFFYSLTQIGEMLLEGEIQRILRGRRMNRQIKDLSNHAIICGLGRMGQAIARELQHKDQDFLIIDHDLERIALAQQEGWRWIKGDVSDDEILKQAGIERARCLATVLPDDADNLFCVMSARLLNKSLTIIARASCDSVTIKLKRAGATRIVSPYSTGAVKIAQLLVHPELEDFMEIFSDRTADVDLSVIHIDAESPLKGHCIKDLDLEKRGIMVVGLRKRGQKLQLPPPKDVLLTEEDTLIAVGKSRELGQILSSQ